MAAAARYAAEEGSASASASCRRSAGEYSAMLRITTSTYSPSATWIHPAENENAPVKTIPRPRQQHHDIGRRGDEVVEPSDRSDRPDEALAVVGAGAPQPERVRQVRAHRDDRRDHVNDLQEQIDRHPRIIADVRVLRDVDDVLSKWLSFHMANGTTAERMTRRFYTPQEVAELLGVSPTTVMTRIHAGALPAVRVSDRVFRIPIAAFERFVVHRAHAGARDTVSPGQARAAAW